MFQYKLKQSVLVNGSLRRKVIAIQCTVCTKSVWKRADKVKISKRLFCSRRCQAIGYQNRLSILCSNCKKEIQRTPSIIRRSKTGLLFCSKSCAISKINSLFKRYEKHPNYTTGIASYRKKALELYGHRCANKLCLLKSPPTSMLEVHHIDGCRQNNAPKNLIVLCVFCHKAITMGVKEVKIKLRDVG